MNRRHRWRSRPLVGVCAGEDGLRPRVTIGDIARRLEISKASVSYALNGRPGVSVPVVIGFLLAQRQFVAGVTAGAVK